MNNGLKLLWKETGLGGELNLRYYPGKTALVEVQIGQLLNTNQNHYCWRQLTQYLVLLVLYLHYVSL